MGKKIETGLNHSCYSKTFLCGLKQIPKVNFLELFLRGIKMHDIPNREISIQREGALTKGRRDYDQDKLLIKLLV